MFFFYCYVDHRDLHSFPTRRSSDLQNGTSRPLDWQSTAVAPGEIDLAGGEDRKSTRLNSSHVRISYAVFCLKKKKTRFTPGRSKRREQRMDICFMGLGRM